MKNCALFLKSFKDQKRPTYVFKTVLENEKNKKSCATCCECQIWQLLNLFGCQVVHKSVGKSVRESDSGQAYPHCLQSAADFSFSWKMPKMKENREIDVEVGPLCALVLKSKRFVISVEINRNSDHFSNYFCPLKNDFCYIERGVLLSQFLGRNIVISLSPFCKWKASVLWSCCPYKTMMRMFDL